MRLPLELAALFLAAICQAQTYTDCDPLQKSCPADSAMKDKLSTDFKTASGLPKGWHSVPCKGSINYSGSAALVVGGQGDCPTIETDDYVLFGYFEVKAKASPGQGIVSSIVLQSDARDEVDWEFIGGENYRVQSNYFGKADTSTFDRMKYVPVTDPQNQYHTYAVNWTSAAITWIVDGAPVRTLTYDEAKGGSRFPQTPMRLRLGIWSGGDKSLGEGTIQWAGGLTDFSKAPFTMYIDSVNVVNYSPASQYKYKDTSGSWQSIEVVGGSTGGVVSPGQQAAQQPSQSSSTSGVSSGSAVPPLPIQTSKDKPTTTPTAKVNDTSSPLTTLSPVVNLTTSSSVSAPTGSGASAGASKTSAKPATVATNAASSMGVMREMAGLSVLSAFAFVFFG